MGVGGWATKGVTPVLLLLLAASPGAVAAEAVMWTDSNIDWFDGPGYLRNCASQAYFECYYVVGADYGLASYYLECRRANPTASFQAYFEWGPVEASPYLPLGRISDGACSIAYLQSLAVRITFDSSRDFAVGGLVVYDHLEIDSILYGYCYLCP